MQIIVDTNILFSAILKDSKIRDILFYSPVKFMISEYSFRELEEHFEEIREKTGLEHNEFYFMYKRLLNEIEIIPFAALDLYKNKAAEIVKNIDEEDDLIIAASLAVPESILWSDDASLKKQNSVKVLNTKEIISLLVSPA